MDFKNTHLSLRRPLTSYSKVRSALATISRSRSWFVDPNRLRDKEYLDVGCGPNVHEAFINLDYGWRPEVDLCWDITKGLPLKDATIRGIFSEHCLEHLPFTSIPGVLSEFRRVLKPGGSVRIIVPDGELYLSRYVDITRHHSTQSLPYSEEDREHGIYSPIMSVNRIFRAHGHLFIYDFDTFRQLLEKAGFADIKKEAFGSGRDPTLLIDTESRAVESLYVEASVP